MTAELELEHILFLFVIFIFDLGAYKDITDYLGFYEGIQELLFIDIIFLILFVPIFILCLIIRRVKGNKKTIGGLTLYDIDNMNGYEFEMYIKSVFETLGYEVYHTPLSGDQGADLILTSKEGIRTAVQVKRYTGNVSNGAVQEVTAAKGFHKCTRGMVVTNSYFTDSAIELAEANSIKLIDRNGLIGLIKEVNIMQE